MNFDVVHDIQTAYRKVVDALSRPGMVETIENECQKIGNSSASLPSTSVLATMLLDTEVTFHVVSKRAVEVTQQFNKMTYAKVADVQDADFIFILQDAEEASVLAAIDQAKVGTLVNPHESAMIIMEISQIDSAGDLILTGPGIQHEQSLSIAGSASWLSTRAKKNMEFPLGIDMLLTDKNDSLIGLPRTTKIRKQVTV